MFYLRHFPYLWYVHQDYIPLTNVSFKTFPLKHKFHSLSPAAGHSSLSSDSASQCVWPGETKIPCLNKSTPYPVWKLLLLNVFSWYTRLSGWGRRQFPTRAVDSFANGDKHRSSDGQLPMAGTRLFARGTGCKRDIYKNPFHVPSWHSLKSGHRHVYLWEPFSCPLWHSLNSGHRHVYLWEPFSCPILTLSEIRK